MIRRGLGRDAVMRCLRRGGQGQRRRLPGGDAEIAVMRGGEGGGRDALCRATDSAVPDKTDKSSHSKITLNLY